MIKPPGIGKVICDRCAAEAELSARGRVLPDKWASVRTAEYAVFHLCPHCLENLLGLDAQTSAAADPRRFQTGPMPHGLPPSRHVAYATVYLTRQQIEGMLEDLGGQSSAGYAVRAILIKSE